MAAATTTQVSCLTPQATLFLESSFVVDDVLSRSSERFDKGAMQQVPLCLSFNNGFDFAPSIELLSDVLAPQVISVSPANVFTFGDDNVWSRISLLGFLWSVLFVGETEIVEAVYTQGV